MRAVAIVGIVAGVVALIAMGRRPHRLRGMVVLAILACAVALRSELR